MKPCRKCRRVLPDHEYRSFKHVKNGKTYTFSACETCRYAASREWHRRKRAERADA